MMSKEINKINAELYKVGEEQFFAKHWDDICDEYPDDYNEQTKAYEEAMEEAAWRAYYNDNYLIDSVAEGYFVIGEVYSIDLANKYLAERIEVGDYPTNEAA